MDRELLTGSQASAEVTEIVAAGGPGTWELTDVSRRPSTPGFAGWALTVVYEAPDLPERRVWVYQGALRVEAGKGKELEVEAPSGSAFHLSFIAWGADRNRSGSDIWMSSGVGADSVSQELLANPFRGRAEGYAGQAQSGTDVLDLPGGVVFPRAAGSGSAVTLRLRAWGDQDQSDPFTLGGVSVVTEVPASSVAEAE
jgi:hypothetical protein